MSENSLFWNPGVPNVIERTRQESLAVVAGVLTLVGMVVLLVQGIFLSAGQEGFIPALAIASAVWVVGFGVAFLLLLQAGEKRAAELRTRAYAERERVLKARRAFLALGGVEVNDRALAGLGFVFFPRQAQVGVAGTVPATIDGEDGYVALKWDGQHYSLSGVKNVMLPLPSAEPVIC